MEEVVEGVVEGEEGVVEGGVGGCLLQQGPIQAGCFSLALVDGSSEHLMWSHPLHFVHCTDLGPSLFVHTGQNQGPGFCSTPALMSRSRIRQAGLVLFFVKHTKNSVQRNRPLCQS